MIHFCQAFSPGQRVEHKNLARRNYSIRAAPVAATGQPVCCWPSASCRTVNLKRIGGFDQRRSVHAAKLRWGWDSNGESAIWADVIA